MADNEMLAKPLLGIFFVTNLAINVVRCQNCDIFTTY